MLEVFPFQTCWIAVPDINVARCGHTTMSVGNCVYAIGGVGINNTILNHVEFLDEPTESWHVTREMPSGIYCHTARVAHESLIYIFGDYIWCYGRY